MKHFFVHDADGQVMYAGECADSDLELQGQADGLTSREGEAKPGKQYWNGVTLQNFPDLPSEHHVWDWATHTYVDPRTLDQIKGQQWEKVKASRDSVEFGGFVWDGSTFDSDQESQSRIQGAAQLATLATLNNQPFSIDWTLADNSVRTLDASDMIAAGTAMGVHIATTHSIGRTLRIEIDAAVTKEEVEAITWPV